MAKRTRGITPTSAYRPGQAPVKKSLPSTGSPRPGSQPPAAIPGAAPRQSDLDAAIVLAESAPRVPATATATAAATTVTAAAVASHQRGHVKVKPNSLLAARASQEYVYVGEDLRHITMVAIGLFVALIVLWLIVVVANVFGIY